MRLSSVFELLVIALLIAFAASKVIDGPDRTKALAKGQGHHRFTVGRQSQDPPSRHCTCSSLTCNCCRDFSLPIVPVKGPGCATVSYLRDDAMMITMSFGDRVLRNITVNSKKPKPICMGMPGGISKFCGRLYNIEKEGEHFKACLGLELRALDDVEAALRVSCFKFGPSGVNVEPGEAVPAEKSKEDEDEDDDDDYGLGALDDDEDDDDDFGLSGGEDDEDDEDSNPAKDTYNYVDSSDSDADADYTGLGSLSEELFGGFFGSSKKKKTNKVQDEVYVSNPPKIPQQQGHSQSSPPQVNLVVMQPVILSTSKPPKRTAQKNPAKKPAAVNPGSITPAQTTTAPTPVKKIKTTSAPVRTLPPSPIPSVTASTTQPPKHKKKKKPSRKRNPTTAKPIIKNSTDRNPEILTTMTVNVVQGGVNLNNTTFQAAKPALDTPLKIPMSQPVIETKPVEPVKQLNIPLKINLQESMPENYKISTNTEKSLNESYESTEGNELTTYTVMQNTIPSDDNLKDNFISNQVTIKIPDGQQNSELDMDSVDNTTPNTWYPYEETTNQETTILEQLLNYSNKNFDNFLRNPEHTTTVLTETTENYTGTIYEVTTEDSTHTMDYVEVKNQGLGTVSNSDSTQLLSSATVSYGVMEEGTEKTEYLINIYSSTEKSSSKNENNDDDDEDDDGGIGIGADLGLDDDDDDNDGDEEETSQGKPLTNLKPEEKDDEDDILDDLLDDEDDDNDGKTKGEERGLGNNPPYRINPFLYRLAKVSTGSIATARHLPRFSDGRNRRNNKRMRFPSLELTP